MKKQWLILLMSCFFYASSSQAGIVITGTRVIYPEKDKEITIQLNNTGKTPSLAQSWIEYGDSNNKKAVPFILTPAMSRLEPGKGQMLRVIYTKEPLPSDRESLFYFNVLDIPPKPQNNEAESNYLQLSIRSRLKMFFRPSGLNMDTKDAYKQVTWQVKNAQLIATNNSPFYITYKEIAVTSNGKKYPAEEIDMLAPKTTTTLKVNGLSGGTRNMTVNYVVINDFGGLHSDSAQITN